MLQFILERYNYWIVIILMMTGLYIVFSRGNLVKKIIGLNIFQTSVFIFYITIGKIAGGTAPILPPDHGSGDHGGEDHGGEDHGTQSDHANEVVQNTDTHTNTINNALDHAKAGDQIDLGNKVANTIHDKVANVPTNDFKNALKELNVQGEVFVQDPSLNNESLHAALPEIADKVSNHSLTSESLASVKDGLDNSLLNKGNPASETLALELEKGTKDIVSDLAGGLASQHDPVTKTSTITDHGSDAIGDLIYSNPLPHVLILTAIVVGVATTAVGLALAVRIREAYGTLEEDELEAADDIAEFGQKGSYEGAVDLAKEAKAANAIASGGAS